MAAGVLDAAKKYGIQVPKEFSVIGYDDIPLSALLSPPLTTILQDNKALGKKAVQLLCAVIQNDFDQPQQIKITPSLITRDSTAELSI